MGWGQPAGKPDASRPRWIAARTVVRTVVWAWCGRAGSGSRSSARHSEALGVTEAILALRAARNLHRHVDAREPSRPGATPATAEAGRPSTSSSPGSRPPTWPPGARPQISRHRPRRAHPHEAPWGEQVDDETLPLLRSSPSRGPGADPALAHDAARSPLASGEGPLAARGGPGDQPLLPRVRHLPPQLGARPGVRRPPWSAASAAARRR